PSELSCAPPGVNKTSTVPTAQRYAAVSLPCAGTTPGPAYRCAPLRARHSPSWPTQVRHLVARQTIQDHGGHVRTYTPRSTKVWTTRHTEQEPGCRCLVDKQGQQFQR